jgi:hypothetical protein
MKWATDGSMGRYHFLTFRVTFLSPYPHARKDQTERKPFSSCMFTHVIQYGICVLLFASLQFCYHAIIAAKEMYTSSCTEALDYALKSNYNVKPNDNYRPWRIWQQSESRRRCSTLSMIIFVVWT